MKRTLILVSFGFLITPPLAFGQSASYLSKADPPSEDVRTLKNPFARSKSFERTPAPGTEAAEMEASARNLIQEQLLELSETGTPLPVRVHSAEQQTRRVGNKWATTYDLSIAGVPLSEASNISSLTMEDGSAIVVRERNVPRSLNFDPVQGQPTTIPIEEAESAARFDLAQLAKSESDTDTRGLALTKSQIEIWVDPRTRTGKLAWALDLSRDDSADTPAAAYRIWVDALAVSDPVGVFEVKNLIVKEQMVSVTGPVWDPTPLDPFQFHPLPRARVQFAPVVLSESPAATLNDLTNEDGAFDVTGVEDKKVIISLQNEYFVIRNAQGATVKVSGIISDDKPPPPLQFSSASEFEIAQPSAFYWANRARGFVGNTLKGTDLVGIEVVVNSDPDCNASFNPLRNRLTLFRASVPASSRTCINKAYADTVFHEFGHAVDHAVGGVASGREGAALSEGLGDSLAILFKNHSCYGANHQGPLTCLRDANTPKIMFTSPNLKVHQRGRVYSGFTWELLQALKQRFPEAQALTMAKQLTLGATAQNPSGIRNAVELTFLADDDDLDLTNGTPNAVSIKAAANARGIPLPAQLP